jgi:hypothetical protein
MTFTGDTFSGINLNKISEEKCLCSHMLDENILLENSQEVYICLSSGAVAYHSHYCGGLKKCKQKIVKVSLSEAKSRGYRACKTCY